MSERYYQISKDNLDKNYEYLKKLLGDSITLRKWYNNELRELDIA